MMLTLVAVWIIVSPSYAQHPNDIYRVEAADCPDGRNAVQTGFVKNGFDGILTALHGVVGCKIIRARSAAAKPYPLLKVSKVDIERDVALLTSNNSNDVFTPNTNMEFFEPDPSSKAHVWGFPRGISLYETPLSIPGLYHIRQLDDLVPAQQRSAMKSRNSPSLESEVVSVNGNLMPGHSGAPIFSETGKIIGIANGGISEGEFGIGWGSLPTRMSLVDADLVVEELNRISISESTGNFRHVETSAISTSGVVERTSTLALLSPALFRVWIEPPSEVSGDAVINPKIRRTVADREDEVVLVINMDGDQKLARNMLEQVQYQYFRNWEGTRYAAWLQAFHEGRSVRISNIAHYIMADNGTTFKGGGPYDEAGLFADQLTLRSNYPEELNYFTFNYNWSNGRVTIGGTEGRSLSRIRLVIGGSFQNEVFVSAVPDNTFQSDEQLYDNGENWYAYLVEETEVGLIPVSNTIFRDEAR